MDMIHGVTPIAFGNFLDYRIAFAALVHIYFEVSHYIRHTKISGFPRSCAESAEIPQSAVNTTWKCMVALSATSHRLNKVLADV